MTIKRLYWYLCLLGAIVSSLVGVLAGNYVSQKIYSNNLAFVAFLGTMLFLMMVTEIVIVKFRIKCRNVHKNSS